MPSLSVLQWIILTALLGGVLSVATAALFAYSARSGWVPALISYAVGALLGAAFLEVLPHAFSSSGDPSTAASYILGGILLFFVLEKLVLWRHCHFEDCEGHDHAYEKPGHSHGHDHGRSGLLILVGDTFHNFVDGVLIAAAFLEDINLGIITAAAIVAHEIPQEVGDFVILLHSGYSKARAFAYNLLSSFATLVGGLMAYYALSSAEGAIPAMLALAAASMIYVAVADLIPGLHKRAELSATVQQVVLIGLGIGSIALAEHLVHRFGGH